MTLTQSTALFLGLAPSGDQLGFLLTALLAFALGWTCKVIRDKRRVMRWKRKLWRGERLGVRR